MVNPDKIKTYTGPTMQAVMEEVKADLGQDALILHTSSEKKRNMFNLSGKTIVRIKACLPENKNGSHPGGPTSTQPIEASPPKDRWGVEAVARQILEEKKSGLEPSPKKEEKDKAPVDFENLLPPPVTPRESKASVGSSLLKRTYQNSAVASEPQGGGDQLSQEVSQLKVMVQELLVRGREHRSLQGLSGALNDMYDFLIKQDVSEAIAEDLIKEANGLLSQNDLDNPVKVRLAVRRLIASRFGDSQAIGLAAQKTRVVALIGPTGVGKTTTIAKIVADLVMTERRRVGLITHDTYRIGAVDQLRTYADIMKIPLQVVLTPSELQQALDRMADFDLVLVDTAGRSPHDHLHMNELGAFLRQLNPDETHLVVSAASHPRGMSDVVEQYRPYGLSQVIFSKLDEAFSYGGLLNTVLETELPVSYLTVGQRVPQDIELSNGDRLARLVLQEDRLGDHDEL